MKNIAPTLTSKTNYIMVRKNKAMRYLIAPPQTSTENGTVLLLQGYGKQAENYLTTLHQLAARGFWTITPDFIGQGKSDNEARHKKQGHITDYRNIISDLDILLNKIILQDLPPPYYILADDMGAVFALIGHDIFAKKIRRQVLVSPLLTPNYHRPNSLFHYYCRIMSDMALDQIPSLKPIGEPKQLNGKILDAQTNLPISKIASVPPSLGWYATILDAIEHIFSNSYIDNMEIPTLVYIANDDKITCPQRTRNLISRLRMAKFISLRSAQHDILASAIQFSMQFWQGFSAFIPGSSFIPSFNENDDYQINMPLEPRNNTHIPT